MTDEQIMARISASVARQSAMTTVGARLVEAKAGSVTFELPNGPHIHQQHGFVHGGVIGLVADSACGYSALTMMPEDRAVLTTEYKIHFLAPAAGEKFIAVGKVIKPGRQITVVQCDVFAVAGDTRKHIAMMVATMISAEKRNGLAD